MQHRESFQIIQYPRSLDLERTDFGNRRSDGRLHVGMLHHSRAPATAAAANGHNLPRRPASIWPGLALETVVTIHGKIVSVDRAKMMVTIQGPDGKTFPIHIYNPYNLAAAKTGRTFRRALLRQVVTVRKKLPNENIPSVSLQQGLISASPGQTPGAGAGTQTQVVATVSAIVTVKNTVELTGPDGVVETVNVENLKL